MITTVRYIVFSTIITLATTISVGVTSASIHEAVLKECSKVAVELPYTPVKFPEKARTNFLDYLEYNFARSNNPQPYELFSSAFSILKQGQNSSKIMGDITVDNTVLDYTTWQDLHLLSGPRSDVLSRLSDKIDRTSTYMGKAKLYSTLVNPITCVSELKTRQEIIRELVSNTSLLSQLDEALLVAKNNQILLLSFWNPNGNDNQRVDEGLFKVPFLCDYFQSSACKKLTSFLNTQTTALEATHRLELASSIFMGISRAAGTVLLPAYGLLKLAGRDEQANAFYGFINRKLGVSNIIGLFSLYGMSSWLLSKAVNNKYTEALYNGVGGVTNFEGSLRFGEFMYGKLVELKYTQTKLLHVAETIRALKMLCKAFDTQSTLQLPEIQYLKEILFEEIQTNPELEQLFAIFQSNTFSGEPSKFSRVGNILAAYNLFNKQKEQVARALKILGTLDMYVSMAKLYKEGNWTFADYQERTDAPHVVLERFWNPFLNSAQAVTNSITLGGDEPKTALITGPNAGGKSTAMRAIAYSLLLGQTFGIAPAEKIIFTPFSKIVTYLQITDDIAAGNSHFKAGVLRAHELIKTVENLAPGSFSFTAVDEVFNGTTYAEGQAAAYALIEALGTRTQNLCLTATHFPLITRLAEEHSTLFKNYKVSVTVKPDGKLEYPFKLEAGIADQNIALDILKEEGFSSALLARAQEVLHSL